MSGAESLSPEAAAAVAAVVGLRQQMQMAAAAQHHPDGNFNLPAHCSSIHSSNGGSAGSTIPIPKMGSPAASGQMGSSSSSNVPIPRLASPAIPGMANNVAHNLSNVSGLHMMQSMLAGGQASQVTVTPAQPTSSGHSTSSHQSHTNALSHHITSTTTVNSGSLNISRISSPGSSAHDLQNLNSPEENQLHSPLEIPLEAGVNLAVGVSGMAYKPSRGYSPPRPEHLFQEDISDFVTGQRSCPSRLNSFKEPGSSIKIEPMTECRGD